MHTVETWIPIESVLLVDSPLVADLFGREVRALEGFQLDRYATHRRGYYGGNRQQAPRRRARTWRRSLGNKMASGHPGTRP